MSRDAVAVLHRGEACLSYFDLEGDELTRVALDAAPRDWVVTADRRRAYINHTGNAPESSASASVVVSVVDLWSHKRLATLTSTGHYALHGMALDGAGALYAVSESHRQLLVSRDPSSGRFDSQQPSGGDGSHQVVVSRDGNTAFVSNRRSDTLTMVFPDDPDCPAAELDSGHHPEGLLLSPDGSRLYVACRESHQIMVVDVVNLQILEPLTTRPGPVRLCWDHRGWLLVALYHDCSLALIDPATGASNHIPLPANPVSVSYDADSGLALVSTLGDEVCVIDVPSRSLDRRLRVHADPGPALLMQLPDWN